jgi:L,D-peptidoglycan transpeptidase YkuD (ErfK/YbiS/YcfS/YnhG family)
MRIDTRRPSQLIARHPIPHRARRLTGWMALATLAACAGPAVVPSTAATADARPAQASQLLVVTTATWDTTGGALRRYARDGDGAWRAEGAPVPVVVGRTGLAWGIGLAPDAAGEPEKREGDGKAPAGAFPLGTAFGFAPNAAAVGTRLPYLPLVSSVECVDDVASTHYNRIVDRGRVPRVDWTSSERMRSIDQYRLGVAVDYNVAPPVAGRGSCIFLHVWSGPASSTAGCTAMPEPALSELVRWLDPERRPVLVQLTDAAYARRRSAWRLP